MLELRRKRVIRAMTGVLLVFGASLAYFLFFNTGLEALSDPSDQYGKVIITNDSVHLIRDISIAYIKAGESILIESIPRLNPGEHHVVLLAPEYVYQSAFTIQVTAPFHLGKQLIIDARAIDSSAANISFSFQYPTVGAVRIPVEPVVETCNNETFPVSVRIALAFDPDSGIADPFPIPATIPPLTCVRSIISFTPLAPSDTLSFKIRVSTPSTVLVEKVHTMRIVPNPAFPSSELDVETDAVLDINASSDANTGMDGNVSVDSNADANGSGSVA